MHSQLNAPTYATSYLNQQEACCNLLDPYHKSCSAAGRKLHAELGSRFSAFGEGTLRSRATQYCCAKLQSGTMQHPTAQTAEAAAQAPTQQAAAAGQAPSSPLKERCLPPIAPSMTPPITPQLQFTMKPAKPQRSQDH